MTKASTPTKLLPTRSIYISDEMRLLWPSSQLKYLSRYHKQR